MHCNHAAVSQTNRKVIRSVPSALALRQPLLCRLPGEAHWETLHPGSIERLVVELAVRVLAEQRLSHGRQSAVLEDLEPGLKRVVDIDLAATTEDDQTTGTVMMMIPVSTNYPSAARPPRRESRGKQAGKLTSRTALRSPYQ